MTQPRRTNSYSLEPDIEGLDSSSAWVGDESAVIPPVALEPYDWTLEDDKKILTQVIPIAPPVRDGSAKLRRPKRKSESPETSVLIPVEKIAPGKAVGKNGAQPAPALPLPGPQVAPSQPDRVTSALPRPKRMSASLLLLLLSVITVFVLAYIAQK